MANGNGIDAKGAKGAKNSKRERHGMKNAKGSR
jgi:hypothetical protein